MSTPKKSSRDATRKASDASAKLALITGKSKEGNKSSANVSTTGTKRERVGEKGPSPLKAARVGGKNAKVPKRVAVTKIVSEPELAEEDEEGIASDAESSGSETASKEDENKSEKIEAVEESEDDEDEDGEMLHGLSDLSDADSSDEDEAGSIGEISKSGVVRLPSSRDDATVKTRLDNVHKKRKESGKVSRCDNFLRIGCKLIFVSTQSTAPMVLYFGRVPKSMPEDPLRAYLTQFGDIARLRLSRNKRTGASKHYAFVEFKDEEVGKIVQETMNNYLLEGRLLQVRILPKDKIHPSMWVGADRKWRKVPETRRFRVKHDDTKTNEEKNRVQKKLLKRQEQRRQKIKSQGIDYDFVGYVAS